MHKESKICGYEVSDGYIKNPKTGKYVIPAITDKYHRDRMDFKSKLDSTRKNPDKDTRSNFWVKSDRIPKSAKMTGDLYDDKELSHYSPSIKSDYKKSISKNINDYKDANQDIETNSQDADYYLKRADTFQKDIEGLTAARKHEIDLANNSQSKADAARRKKTSIVDKARAKHQKKEESANLKEESYNTFGSTAQGDFESVEAFNSALKDDINTITEVMNDLRYKMNTNNAVYAIEEAKNDMLSVLKVLAHQYDSDK